jgi:hypothetical protein
VSPPCRHWGDSGQFQAGAKIEPRCRLEFAAAIASFADMARRRQIYPIPWKGLSTMLILSPCLRPGASITFSFKLDQRVPSATKSTGRVASDPADSQTDMQGAGGTQEAFGFENEALVNGVAAGVL